MGRIWHARNRELVLFYVHPNLALIRDFIRAVTRLCEEHTHGMLTNPEFGIEDLCPAAVKCTGQAGHMEWLVKKRAFLNSHRAPPGLRALAFIANPYPHRPSASVFFAVTFCLRALCKSRMHGARTVPPAIMFP